MANADLALSPDMQQMVARKSPSHALLPQSLHSGSDAENTFNKDLGANMNMQALSPRDDEHTYNEAGIMAHV